MPVVTIDEIFRNKAICFRNFAGFTNQIESPHTLLYNTGRAEGWLSPVEGARFEIE